MGARSLEGIKAEVDQGRLTIDGYDTSIPNISFTQEIRPRGSNGLVFKCNDTVLKRPVAVKVWIPRRRDSRNRDRQALAEASKIAQLNHNNIVRIYQCSRLQNGWVYSVMEYVEGVSLAVFLDTVRPDFIDCYRLWRQIEDALKYSHELDVFHGDLHPGNILVLGDAVKLIDFGTSLFASRRVDSRMRETKLLIDLNRRMFRQCDLRLSDVVDVELKAIDPVRVLDILSAWVNILFEWHQMFHVRRTDDWLITQTHSLALPVMQAPVFSVPRITGQLARKQVSAVVQSHFIARCVCWTIVFLDPPEKSKRYKLPTWSFNDVSLDPRANEAILEERSSSLRKIFLENGPLQ